MGLRWNSDLLPRLELFFCSLLNSSCLDFSSYCIHCLPFYQIPGLLHPRSEDFLYGLNLLQVTGERNSSRQNGDSPWCLASVRRRGYPSLGSEAGPLSFPGGCLPACLRAAACLLSLTGQSSASCFINSTASLPVFTLITCWGGGGRRQGARWPTLELQASPVEERSVGLAQPQASEVALGAFSRGLTEPLGGDRSS